MTTEPLWEALAAGALFLACLVAIFLILVMLTY